MIPLHFIPQTRKFDEVRFRTDGESRVRPEELIVYDDSLVNAYEIVADICSSREHDQFEVVSISATVDGMDQVTAILASRHDISAMHLVIATEDGINRLGNTPLFADRLDGYTGDLVAWQDSLTENPEIIVHGFRPETETHATDLESAFASLTGAEVYLLPTQ